MADTITPAQRSAVMRRVRAKDTSPELAVRRAFHKHGFRYRLHDKSLPGKPDLVFKKHRMIVFVHGCFWHWHGCKRSRMPSSNVPYWTSKIARNVERDKSHRSALEASGWRVETLWECAIEEGLGELIQTLADSRN